MTNLKPKQCKNSRGPDDHTRGLSSQVLTLFEIILDFLIDANFCTVGIPGQVISLHLVHNLHYLNSLNKQNANHCYLKLQKKDIYKRHTLKNNASQQVLKA